MWRCVSSRSTSNALVVPLSSPHSSPCTLCKHEPNLHDDVSLMAALSSLPPDIDLSTKGQGTGLPLDAVAYYTRSGTSRDLSLPILAAQRAEELRQQRRHVTEREIEQTIEE